jgi:hypothetical protein
MVDVPARDELIEQHRETYQGFSKLVLFACLHIGLVLACLALAFLGGIPLLALLLGLGGTAAMIVAFFVLT